MDLEEESQDSTEFEDVSGFSIEDDKIVIYVPNSMTDKRKEEIRKHFDCNVEFQTR